MESISALGLRLAKLSFSTSAGTGAADAGHAEVCSASERRQHCAADVHA